jgi:hypothetical protein
MPSTYSSLKIQLMATGENNTTWGNVTNTNLGTAIEEALVGSEDVTFASANVTLTLTDTNASQTARNLRLRCIGTTGGSTRNLVVPSIEKPYILQNECADSILIKTAAGSGVTVPAGKTMWVYNNGTDVVDTTSHLTSLTLGTALPVLSGGTGSNIASGARTNLGASTAGSNLFTVANPSAVTFLRFNADNSVSTLAASAFRTAIGSTTLGDNLYTITNPSAVTFPRFNADNTVSALSAADMRTAIGASTGTVTSVSGAGTVNGLTLTGTVTSTGNLTLGGTLSGVDLTSQVTGTLPVASGGTGGTTQATARSGIGAAASGTNTDITTMNPAAGLQIGSPTDGAKGAGTINAAGLFVNGVSVGTSTGTVSSVGGTGSVNGITLSGTVTSTGNLTLGGSLSGVSLTTQVSGTLPIANGGTNATSASGARTQLGATTLGGNLFIITNPDAITFPRFNADNTVSALSAADLRTATGAGTVTSVAGAGTVNGLTLTGTVTSSGSLTLGGTLSNVNLASQITGTLPVVNGGTGQTSYTNGQLLIGNTTGNTLTKATLTAGSGIEITNAAGAITITSTAGGGSVTSVDVSGGTTGLTTSGGPVTGAGTITIAGTLAVANGGTNATSAGGARTSLGATTVGGNMFTLTNPSAVTFPRFNTDNTVSALDAATFRTAIGAGTGNGNGTVTSVAMSVPAFLSISGSPVTSTGTLAVSFSGTALPVANGGSGATTLTGVLKGNGTGAFSAATAGTDYVAPGGALGTPSSGTLTNCTFPTLNQNTTGSAGSVANAVTFTNTGGALPGTTFNGSAARIIDYGTVGAPKADGTGASGTWGISISGGAASAATATNATNLVMANFSIVESGGYLYIKYGAATILRIDSTGNLIAEGNVTGYGTV